MSGRVAFVNFFGRAIGSAPHGMRFEFEPIGIVDQAVEDVRTKGFKAAPRILVFGLTTPWPALRRHNLRSKP